MMFLSSLLAYLPKILLGGAVAHLVWSETKSSAILLKFFIAPPLGMGITTLLLFIWKLLGLGHTGYIAFELVTVAAVLTIMILARRDTFREIKFSIPVLRSWLDKFLLAALLVSVSASAAGFMLTMLAHPHGHEDAWSNWNLIGRFIYLSKDMSNALDYIASSTFPGYPFMIGLDVANGWIFVNEVTTRIPITVSGLFTYSIPGILFFALLQIKGFRTASMAVILICTPWLAQYGSFLYSDIPLASFYLITSTLIGLYLHSKSPELLTLAGLAAGLSAWTKNDGIPFTILSTLVIFLIAIQKKDKNAFFRFVLGLALPLATVGLYKVFLAESGNIVSADSVPLTRLLDVLRFQTVFHHFATTTSSYGGSLIGYVWVLLAIALVVGINLRNRDIYYLASLLFFQYAIYFGVYLITPLDLQWHLNTSMSRVFTHLIPLFTFFIFYSLHAIPPLVNDGE